MVSHFIENMLYPEQAGSSSPSSMNLKRAGAGGGGRVPILLMPGKSQTEIDRIGKIGNCRATAPHKLTR